MKIRWSNQKERPKENQAWNDYKKKGGKIVDLGVRE